MNDAYVNFVGRLVRRGCVVCVFALVILCAVRSGSALGDDGASAKAATGDADAARQAGERILRTGALVKAPLEDVWHAWTTEEGIRSFFQTDSKIELSIGGAYELYMGMTEPDESGLRGSEGCRVLSYVPMRMLAFEWNFPPAVMSLRKARAKTQVVLQFRQLDGGQVEVSFAQLGWQQGEDWDAGYQYFARAWPHVMAWMKKAVEKTASESEARLPKGGRSPFGTGRRVNRWRINDVDVTLNYGPGQSQTFGVTLPVGVEEAWKLLATAEGLARIGGKEPRVELRPGGTYSFWPGANNTVMAYVPGEVLATSGSAPPQFPNVRNGGTWGGYFFEAAGEKRTRIELVLLGWRPGEKEWDDAFEYFGHNNPIWLDMVQAAAAGEKPGRASGDGESADTVAFTVAAPREAVWKAWTTAEGLSSWMAPHADIDACVGGVMRVSYDAAGSLDDGKAIENRIVALEPRRLMTIQVSRAPEGFPFRDVVGRMKTEIRLEDVSEGGTRVSFVGSGFGDDAESRKMRTYFRKGNAVTARRLQDHFDKTGGM